MMQSELTRVAVELASIEVKSGFSGEHITHILLFRIVELLEDLNKGDRDAREGLFTKTS